MTCIDDLIQVFTPFHRKWIDSLNRNPRGIVEAERPAPNDHEIHSHSSYADLFNQEIPDDVEGFECEDRERMKVIWPEGYNAAKEVRYEYTLPIPHLSNRSYFRRCWSGSYAQNRGPHN